MNARRAKRTAKRELSFRADPLACCHEQLIADDVPKTVVQDLEVIQIEEQHGRASAVGVRMLQRTREMLVEQPAVG